MSEAVTAYRLSIEQERLWNLSGGKELPDAFCELELTGAVDRAALRRAVEETVARHEILRTSFQKKAGVKLPFQVIEREAKVDWNEDSAANKRTQPSGLFSVEFVKVSPSRFRLRFALPALAADGRTLELVVQELGLIYQLFVSGEAIEGEPLQYADIVEWQNELLASEETKAGREFWRTYLQTLDVETCAALRLPLELERGEGFSPDAVTVEKQGAGSADALLACFFALVYRLTGRTQFSVNREYDGRSLEELDGAMGPLAKSLPVGVAISHETSFAQLLQQVTERSREVENWQHSFDGNAGEKAMPVNPLAFEYVELAESRTFGGVEFRLLRREAALEPFTLKLQVERTPEGMRFVFRFDASRLRRETVERWSGHFLTLLEAALERPSERVSRLPLLRAQEREQLLVDWNRTQAQYPRDRKMHELIAEQAARTPDRAAVRSGDDVLSYRELNARAEELAARLRQNGVQAGSLVALSCERSVEMLVGVLGIWKAGCAYVPLASDHPAARLAEQMRGVAAVVTVGNGKQVSRRVSTRQARVPAPPGAWRM